MNDFNLYISDNEPIWEYHVKDLKGQEVNFSQINEALSKITRSYKVPQPTLRWYHNIGLISRPIKKGREAFYPYATIYALHAIRVLRIQYEKSLEEIKELVALKHHIHTIVFVLQSIENKYLVQNGAPGLNTFVNNGKKILQKTSDMSADIQVALNPGDLQQMIDEWQALPHYVLLAKAKNIPKLRKDYFKMIISGADPLMIGINYNESP